MRYKLKGQYRFENVQNDGNYLMTFIVESEYTSIYYLSLDNELNFEGDGMGTPLVPDANWSMLSSSLVSGNDNYTYLAYSGQKYGSSSILSFMIRYRPK